MKTQFVTAIYSDLYGTGFGGRIGRKDHYRFSLLSHLKMTNADFICYTSDREKQDLENFFYDQQKISQNKIKFIAYELSNNKHSSLINSFKNIEATKKSDRCIEIQYCKFEWLDISIADSSNEYDYYYWIDAGLSHCGLIPTKYRSVNLGHRGYFESSLFNNLFLQNLNDFTKDKIFLIGKENSRNYWDNTVNPKHYNNYNNSYHIIGGLFGGTKPVLSSFISLFDNNLTIVTNEDNRLYHEEHIMGLIWRNNEHLFNVKFFDTWWHESMTMPGVDMEQHVKLNKSFYKILEELN